MLNENSYGWQSGWGEINARNLRHQGLDEVVTSLRKEVLVAQQALDARNHDQVEAVFGAWEEAGVQAWLFSQELLTSDQIDSQQVGLVAVGMLGLCRIFHTDVNNQIGQQLQPEFVPHQIDRVEKVYAAIDPQQVPQVSIHGRGVYWPSEIQVDRGVTANKTGEAEAATAWFYTAWTQALQYVHIQKQAEVPDIKGVTGAYSAAAVALGRQARLEQDLSRISPALEYMHQAMTVEPNPGRRKNLLKWAISLALNPRTQTLPGQRFAILRSAVPQLVFGR